MSKNNTQPSSSSRHVRPTFRYTTTDSFVSPVTSTAFSEKQHQHHHQSDFPMDEKRRDLGASSSTTSSSPQGSQSIPQRGTRGCGFEPRHSSPSPSSHYPQQPDRIATRSPMGVPSSPIQSPSALHPSQYNRYPGVSQTPDDLVECCGCSVSQRVKTWIPLGLWIITTIGFLVAIAWWKEDVFTRLEELSDWIRSQGYQGQAILFCLIFITTFPPMPLYSTFITLSGYCLGAYHGAVLSYFAALTGAIAVFLLSRTYLRGYINDVIANAPVSVKRAIRVVEKQPKLLFLIRLSPYPYNLMNALLATSRLSFSTYTTCTALSLFKVLVHTTIGSSIHKFSDLHKKEASKSDDVNSDSDYMNKVWTILGAAMCVALLVYLSWVANKAVHDAEEEEEYGSTALPSHYSNDPHCRSPRYPYPYAPYTPRRQVPAISRGRTGAVISTRDLDEDELGENVAFLSPAAQDDSRRPSFDHARLGGSRSRDSSHVTEMAETRAESPLRLVQHHAFA